MPKLAPDLLKTMTLLAAAVILAAAANGLARVDRKLDWRGWAPPPATGPQPAAPAPLPPAPSRAPDAPGPLAPARPRPSAPPLQAASASAAPPLMARAPMDAAARFPPSPAAVIRDISSEDAWEAYRLKVPFLDARRTPDFLEGHVPGAWSVPVWEADLAARITEFEARANPGLHSAISLYCAGGDCEDSRMLARKLVELGYRNLLIYRDGFPDWQAKGRPVERGGRP